LSFGLHCCTICATQIAHTRVYMCGLPHSPPAHAFISSSKRPQPTLHWHVRTGALHIFRMCVCQVKRSTGGNCHNQQVQRNVTCGGGEGGGVNMVYEKERVCCVGGAASLLAPTINKQSQQTGAVPTWHVCSQVGVQSQLKGLQHCMRCRHHHYTIAIIIAASDHYHDQSLS
jgi:hypothetical protein